MRLASLALDGWELRSAEDAHARNPTTFWIPALEHRRALRRGQGVKLLFDIQKGAARGSAGTSGERMWVVVGERAGERFVGRLATEPTCLPVGEAHYLCVGAEILFGAEHVADIDDPPNAYASRILSGPPKRRWPRGVGR
jgi:hypothetical protein